MKKGSRSHPKLRGETLLDAGPKRPTGIKLRKCIQPGYHPIFSAALVYAGYVLTRCDACSRSGRGGHPPNVEVFTSWQYFASWGLCWATSLHMCSRRGIRRVADAQQIMGGFGRLVLPGAWGPLRHPASLPNAGSSLTTVYRLQHSSKTVRQR